MTLFHSPSHFSYNMTPFIVFSSMMGMVILQHNHAIPCTI